MLGRAAGVSVASAGYHGAKGGVFVVQSRFGISASCGTRAISLTVVTSTSGPGAKGLLAFTGVVGIHSVWR